MPDTPDIIRDAARLHIVSGRVAPDDAFDSSHLESLFDIDASVAEPVINALVADDFLERSGRRPHVRDWPPGMLAQAFDTGAAIEASVMAHIAGRPTAAPIIDCVDAAIQHGRSGDTAYESAIRDLEIGTRIVAAGGTEPLLAMYDSAVPVAAFYHAAGRYRPEKRWLAHLRALRVALKASDPGASGCAVMTWRAAMIEPASDRAGTRAVGGLR